MLVQKMKFLVLAVQKLLPEQIHRQTDTQTDLTEIPTYPHMRMVNICRIWICILVGFSLWCKQSVTSNKFLCNKIERKAHSSNFKRFCDLNTMSMNLRLEVFLLSKRGVHVKDYLKRKLLVDLANYHLANWKPWRCSLIQRLCSVCLCL